MNSKEIEKELSMSYSDLVDYLLKKYGEAKYDYFCNETCRSKNKKATRTSEGLIVHHIDEDKGLKLSDPRFAKLYPYDFQKADRLVYCNALEHLILHVKIIQHSVEGAFGYIKPYGFGGTLAFMVPELNDFYSGHEYVREFEIKKFSLVAKNFDDYIKILRYLLEVVEKDERYSKSITKEMLARDWDRHQVKKIYTRL